MCFRFPVPLSILYARKHFDAETIKTALDFVEDIRDALIDILQEASWLDEITKNEAIKKAKAIKAYIGYPNEQEEIDKLEEYYKDLEMEPDNFFVNLLRFEVFEIEQYYKKLGEPVKKMDWDALPVLDLASVNAYNQPAENTIRIKQFNLLPSIESVIYFQR